MDDLDTQKRPALAGLVGDPGQSLFGHAGEVLEEHAPNLTAVIEIAHIAHERDHGADAEVGGMQRIEFAPRIERLAVYADGHE